MTALQIVWFKRDLRVDDHRPSPAARTGAAAVLVEPELWQQPDASERQWLFAGSRCWVASGSCGSGPTVGRALRRCGGGVGAGRRQFGIDGLWSHQETGNGWTYQRDKRGDLGLKPWYLLADLAQFGVVRSLRSRGWAKRWELQMSEPIMPAPAALQALEGIDPGEISERLFRPGCVSAASDRRSELGSGGVGDFCSTVPRGNGRCRAPTPHRLFSAVGVSHLGLPFDVGGAADQLDP